MKYTPEFKQDAIYVVVEQGYRPTEVAWRLGIEPANVSHKVREYKKNKICACAQS